MDVDPHHIEMAMTPDSGGELGSRYMQKTLHFPFVVRIYGYDWWTLRKKNWMYNMGTNHVDWEWWWNSSDSCYLFEFKYEEDKVKFILRWL